MADGVFNIAKGSVAERVRRVANNDPANSALIIVILKAAEADATLQDYDSLDDILTEAGNTEADFTNYARKTLTDSDLSDPTVDDTDNRVDSDIPDQTWASAGGASDNTTAKILVCYDPDTTSGDDSNIIPLTHHDFAETTDGNDLVAQVNTAGFHRAS
jgi:hypothetical protein